MLGIPATGTIRADRCGGAPLKSMKEHASMDRGDASVATHQGMGLSASRWSDNSVVTVMSNTYGHEPTTSVERWSASENRKVTIQRPASITHYNQHMGGVDLLDSYIATYRIKIKSKKWWWAHFKNNISILAVSSFKLWKQANPDETRDFLYFIRYVATAWLAPGKEVRQYPRRSTMHGPERVSSAIRLNCSHGHWPIAAPKPRRCAIPSCTSKPKTLCQLCDVTLCVGEHWIKFHTQTSAV